MADREAASPARVLVVDDHPVVREGVAINLASHAEFQLCGEAEDISTALRLVETTNPDIVLVDISLKDGNGIDLIKRIRTRNTAVRILVWSMYPTRLYAERALRAGANGYVNKSRSTREILEALRTVVDGRVYLCPEATEELLDRVGSGRPPPGSPLDELSDRELETFELLGFGLGTKEIAQRMGVSPKTVETYRFRVRQKLGVTSLTALIQRATQWVLEQK